MLGHRRLLLPGFCASDINQDGIVSVPDLLILLGEFAGGCTP